MTCTKDVKQYKDVKQKQFQNHNLKLTISTIKRADS